MRSEALHNSSVLSRIRSSLGVSQKLSTDFTLILLANAVNNGTNFIANILIARMFGHEMFGLFSIAVNIAMTTLIFSEFGMNLTMVRFYKRYQGDIRRSNAVLLWNLYFKAAVLSLLILFAVASSKTLSHVLTQRSDKAILVGISLIGGGLLGFWSYQRAFYQAIDVLKKIAHMTFSYAVLRLVFLFVFIVLSIYPNAELLFTGIYLVPIFIVLAAAFSAKNNRAVYHAAGKGDLVEAGRDFMHYSKWVAVSSVSYVLIQKSMFFIAAFKTDVRHVSLLSAGLLFTGIFLLIGDSIRQVLFPKAAQLDAEGIRRYTKRIVRLMPVYILLCLLLLVILSACMNYALGREYRESLPLFWITGASVAVTIGFGFYNVLYHTIMKPRPDTLINIGTLVVSILLNLIAVQRYGLTGLVITFGATLATGEIVKAIVLSRYLKRM